MRKTYRCEKCGDMTVKLSDELIDNIRASMLGDVIDYIESYNSGLTCCMALTNRLAADIEEKFDVQR